MAGLVYSGDEDISSRGTTEHPLARALLKADILAPRPGPQQPIGPSARRNASGQTTNRAETQPHPSAERLPEGYLSLTPPLDTFPDTALPTRGMRPTSRQEPVPPRRKPAQASKPASSMRRRHQEQEEQLPCGLQNGGHKHRDLDTGDSREIRSR